MSACTPPIPPHTHSQNCAAPLCGIVRPPLPPPAFVCCVSSVVIRSFFCRSCVGGLECLRPHNSRGCSRGGQFHTPPLGGKGNTCLKENYWNILRMDRNVSSLPPRAPTKHKGEGGGEEVIREVALWLVSGSYLKPCQYCCYSKLFRPFVCGGA